MLSPNRITTSSRPVGWEFAVRTVAGFGSKIATILARQLRTIWSSYLDRHGNVASLVSPGDSHGIIRPLFQKPYCLSFIARRRDISPLDISIGSSPAAESVLAQPDKSDIIGLSERKGIVARFRCQEKALVNDSGLISANGLTVEVSTIIDKQAVGSAVMLWFLAREGRRVIFCKRR